MALSPLARHQAGQEPLGWPWTPARRHEGPWEGTEEGQCLSSASSLVACPGTWAVGSLLPFGRGWCPNPGPCPVTTSQASEYRPDVGGGLSLRSTEPTGVQETVSQEVSPSQSQAARLPQNRGPLVSTLAVLLTSCVTLGSHFRSPGLHFLLYGELINSSFGGTLW